MSPDFNDLAFYHFENCSTDIASTNQKIRTGIRSGIFEQLSVKECLREYAQQYVSRRGDLLLVQNKTSLYKYSNDHCTLKYRADTMNPWNSTFIRKFFPSVIDPHDVPSYDWQCPWPGDEYCSVTNVINSVKSGKSWEPFGDPVQYCWSERLHEECTLTFNAPIGVAVIACNLIKACCMCLTLLLVKDSTLMTLGDAIESFMDCPDKHTAGMSIFCANRLTLLWKQERIATAWPDTYGGRRRQETLHDKLFRVWTPKARRWKQSASPSRYFCYIL